MVDAPLPPHAQAQVVDVWFGDWAECSSLMERLHYCLECGSKRLAWDHRAHVVFCTDCGSTETGTGVT